MRSFFAPLPAELAQRLDVGWLRDLLGAFLAQHPDATQARVSINGHPVIGYVAADSEPGAVDARWHHYQLVNGRWSPTDA